MKRKRTLRKRLARGFLMASLIPVIIFAVVSQIRLRSSLEDNINGRISSNIDNADQCLEMVLDKYATILYDMCTDDTIIDTVEAIIQDQDDMDVNSSTLRHELSHICNRNPGIEGITIFLRNGSTIFYDRLNSSSTNSVWADKIVFPEIEKGEVYQGITVPVTANEKKNYLFQIGRKLVDYKNIHEQLGTVVISINEEQIKAALVTGDDNATYLLDGDTVISAPDSSDIGRKFSKIQNTAANIYTEAPNAKSGFTLCNEQPLKDYHMAIWEQVIFLFVIAAISSVTMLLLIYRFTRPYLFAVDSLVEAMNEAEEGNFAVSVEVPDNMPVEIRRISAGFNEMVVHIDNLIGQVKEAVVEQKNAELSALEAQIDPHFLYNTLDTINWKAIENEQYDISEMVGALADILRYTVKNAGGTTTIRQEMGWLREYTMLQAAKLGKKLKIDEQVPEEIMGHQIHKLLLQPFVENAIKHGFREKEGECRLRIFMRPAGEQIHIIIEDNGKGIAPQMLKKLNDDTEEMDGHVGITNVRKRLKLYYGEEADIYFESLAGSYTRAHLFIPYHTASGMHRSEEEVFANADRDNRR